MDIICDIDGTIADLSHRRHWVEQKPKNWKMFFRYMVYDQPIRPVVEVIAALGSNADHRIIFCSGRPAEWESETRGWIEKQFDWKWYASPLYMRSTGDYRPDDVIKFELLQKIRADGYKPIIAFDDRQRVVDMWRKNGIICAQVAEGNF